MKNNKKVTYFLLLLVVGLWGGIVYKVFTSVSTNEEVVIEDTYIIPRLEIENEESFVVLGGYIDPFLKKSFKRRQQPSSISASSTPRPKPPKPSPPTPPPVPIQWPQLDYHGTFNNGKTGMLDINNKPHVVHTNQQYDGITILSITKDYIQVSYKDSTKVSYTSK